MGINRENIVDSNRKIVIRDSDSCCVGFFIFFFFTQELSKVVHIPRF